jgi:hypothetical protein
MPTAKCCNKRSLRLQKLATAHATAAANKAVKAAQAHGGKKASPKKAAPKKAPAKKAAPCRHCGAAKK